MHWKEEKPNRKSCQPYGFRNQYKKINQKKKTQVFSWVAKTKNEGNNFKSEKSQDYSRKHNEIVKI